MGPLRTKAIRSAFEEIVEGRSVRRSRHELSLDGEDLTPLFLEVLRSRGYHPRRVRDIPVMPGERVPAFLVADRVAFFGWVFWEKFSATRMRKLFGSVVRNGKGDWALQLSARHDAPVYVNIELMVEMDIDHPATM